MTMITDLLNINVAMNCYKRAQALHVILICFDAMHYVKRPIMEAKRTLENIRPPH